MTIDLEAPAKCVLLVNLLETKTFEWKGGKQVDVKVRDRPTASTKAPACGMAVVCML